MAPNLLITGASQGTGRATALLFARQGYNVVLAARKPDRLASVAQSIQELGRQAWAIPTDVAHEGQVKALVEQAIAVCGTIDVLVNNAGICLSGPVEHTSITDWEQVMGTNFWGYVYTINALLPHFLARQLGTIVNVGSFGGKMPLPQMTAYCASKYAVSGLTESLRLELAPRGIHVCAVHPGVINSDFLERAMFRDENELGVASRSQNMAKILQSGLVSQPDDIAQAIWKAVKYKGSDVVVGSTAIATEAYRLFPQLTEYFLKKGVNVTH
jgi:short-subunit dehydrogenase